MLAKNFKNLTVAEKIMLVEDLWDDIASQNKQILPDNEEILFVKQRLKDIKKSPDRQVSWNDIKAKARKSAK